MKKEEFFSELAKEFDQVDGKFDENSSLHLTSLMQLSLISFLDEHFGIRIKAIDLKEIDSMNKLIALIGKDKLE
jgi:acyl carrier protein